MAKITAGIFYGYQGIKFVESKDQLELKLGCRKIRLGRPANIPIVDISLYAENTMLEGIGVKAIPLEEFLQAVSELLLVAEQQTGTRYVLVEIEDHFDEIEEVEDAT